MAHFVLTRATWNNGTAVVQGDLESLDAKVFAAIDGDSGGCWAPSSSISLSSASGGALHLSGPLVLYSGGIAGSGKLSTSGSATIQLDANDFPRLATGHKDTTRLYVTSCLAGLSYLSQASYPVFGVRPHMQYGGLQAVAAKFQLSDGSIVTNTWRIPLRVSNGSTLSAVSVTYRSILGSPKMRVERVDDGGTATPLTSSALGADADGYITAAPTDTSTDPTTGLPAMNAAVIPIDGGASPANALVDNSLYTYFLRVVEDQTLPSTYPSMCAVRAPVKRATVGANNTRSGLALLDGILLVSGDRVLVKDQTNPAENGIYIATAGAWGYAPDSDIGGNPADGGKYPQGLIVPVIAGTVNSGSFWQLQQSSVATLGVSPQTYASLPANPLTALSAFFAHGNLYYDIDVLMVGITDDRWQ